MSISGYFEKTRPENRMPRNEGFDPATGIASNGDVMSGRLSPTLAIELDARRTMQGADARNFGYGAGRVDPVLRFHLGLDQPGGPREPEFFPKQTQSQNRTVAPPG